MDNLDYHISKSNMHRYSVSKAGNYYHATEFAKKYQDTGVISVALNPGNLDSDLWRTQGSVAAWFLRTFILHPAIHGAYTELFAGLADEVAAKNGAWGKFASSKLSRRLTDEIVVPWGRFMEMTRKDLREGTKAKTEGGSGIAEDFWEWNETQIKPYL